MLKITLGLILMSAIPFCNKCINDGDSCSDSFSFNVADKANSKDLVFSSSQVYNKDSVYLLTTLPGYLGKMSFAEDDRFTSTLLIPVDTLYLRLSVSDTDTLLISYNFVKDKCCSNERYGRISAIKYNGFIADKVADVFILRK